MTGSGLIGFIFGHSVWKKDLTPDQIDMAMQWTVIVFIILFVFYTFYEFRKVWKENTFSDSLGSEKKDFGELLSGNKKEIVQMHLQAINLHLRLLEKIAF